MASASPSLQPIEWIDEPLGSGVKGRSVRSVRAFMALLSGVVLFVTTSFTLMGFHWILIWLGLAVTGLALAIALRFAGLNLPDRIGLDVSEVVIRFPGRECRVKYADIVGISRTPGESTTSLVKFRVRWNKPDQPLAVLLDREIAERVVRKASSP
ncbi:MAG TPA: DUF2244 domain-containing protein [Thermoplasmata archaeon]|nr:DUF2244 domain-containing protein [Thermoplasmata archaeon]